MKAHIKNARYNHSGGIDCEVKHPRLGWIPYTATADDTEKFGRAVYKKAVAGTVAPYQLSESLLAAEARATRDALLRELDKIVSNPLRWNELSEDEKLSLRSYRQALLDIPQQPQFPSQFEWPKNPL